ncbi:hypothetical protein DM860_017104 [Cuscuta australis]|uniref:Uncharacterized protein n=1 Tax=Cuscuta australis TaxID=267555 RepID=A0A328DSQ7_9ASTE|nr:hypothetical protein DM860_017104 [Cuscuta australis]
MELQRLKDLLILCLRSHKNPVSLVGGNHTAARFCTR